MSPVNIFISGNCCWRSINLPSSLAIVRTLPPASNILLHKGTPKKPLPPVTKYVFLF